MTPDEVRARLARCRDALELAHLFGEASLHGPNEYEVHELEAQELISHWAVSIIEDRDSQRDAALTDRELEQLRKVALQGLRHGVASTAQAMLNALDAGFGRHIYQAFCRAGTQVALAEGSPFPMCDAPPSELFGSRHEFSPRPSNLGDPHARRNVLGVYREQPGFRVVFDYGCASLLDAIMERGKIAVAVPNLLPSDLTVATLDLERRRFFDVKPTDELAQRRLIEHLLDRADAAQAGAVLLPELSTTPALALACGQQLRRCRDLQLVAAGSYHFHEGARALRRNRLELHTVHAERVACHDKFNAFEMRQWNGQRYPEPLTEDIAVDKTITVHWATRWSLVTLICKDFLHEGTKQLLLHLRPRFVFVVALSDDIASFIAAASNIAESCQATVIIANFGLAPENDAAIAALPIRLANTPLTVRLPLSQLRGGLAVLDLKSLKLKWK
jgi:hypothetical protein